MRKITRGRRMLTAFGGILVLAGIGPVSPALAANYRAALTGANEVPAGDPDGSGIAEISLDDSLNQVCVQLEVSGIGPATAAHIHRGAAGENGQPVITLDAPDDDQDEDDCDIVADSLIDEMKANPGAFYVNVHTAEFPNGAVRGQIALREEN